MIKSEKKEISSLPDFGGQLAQLLQEQDSFILWLEGSLGAGKTTLVGHIFRALGLNENIPVTSPTYTIMNEYEIKDQWFAHVDLYRGESDLGLADSGLLDAKPYRGIFIEWPQNIGDQTDIQPTHKLSIKICGLNSRTYSFENLTLNGGEE